MFYRKTIKDLKERINVLERGNYNLLRENELLNKKIYITRELNLMSNIIDSLRRDFISLENDIKGRIIK